MRLQRNFRLTLMLTELKMSSLNEDTGISLSLLARGLSDE